jgi:hypothetical protein
VLSSSPSLSNPELLVTDLLLHAELEFELLASEPKTTS